MANSIKTNYIYSLINTLSGILFPLITFPYSSRIMEAEGIGQVGFFSSIIGYITLFTSLGIPIYAIREIARTRDDAREMSKTAIEILLLHTLLVVAGYIIVGLLCITVDKISIDIPLFLVLSLSILFNAVGCEWFYQGIEEFKYIAIRGVIVRLIYIILLFLFVHSKSDILIYAGLSVLGTVGNNIFNFCRLWKYVKPQFVVIKELNIKRHIRPSLRIFILNLVVSLYVNIDTVFIGFYNNNESVGYYEGASRIARLVLSIIQSLQTALVPRFSYLANKNAQEFEMLAQKVFDFVLLISLPMTIGLIVLSPSLISMFCGYTFLPAIITLEIISPIVLMIALSGIASFQILYPLGQEKTAIWASATGAVVNLFLCVLLIPKFAHNGAAIAVLLGETVVTVSIFLYGKKFIKIKKWSQHYLNCLLGTFLMFIAIIPMRFLNVGDIYNIVLTPVIGVVVYFTYLLSKKDETLMQLYAIVLNKIQMI